MSKDLDEMRLVCPPMWPRRGRILTNLQVLLDTVKRNYASMMN